MVKFFYHLSYLFFYGWVRYVIRWSYIVLGGSIDDSAQGDRMKSSCFSSAMCFLKTWLVFIFSFLFTLSFLGCEDSPRHYRIDILCSNPDFEPFAEIVSGFREQMSALGYMEGVNISYQLKDFVSFCDATGNNEGRNGSLNKADLIFTLFTEASVVAKEATKETGIPVVFAYAGIEGGELVNSIREPGGHITGVRYPGPEQISKRLEILSQIAPQCKRIFIGYQRDYPNTEPALSMLRTLAKPLSVTLVEVPVERLEELDRELQNRCNLPDPGMDAILLMPDGINHSLEGWEIIRNFAAEHDLPIAGSFLYTVEQGALFGNANHLPDIGRLAARLVHKILQGIHAGTIPVVTPEQDLFINYKRAEELGFQVPEGLLRQADKIIR